MTTRTLSRAAAPVLAALALAGCRPAAHDAGEAAAEAPPAPAPAPAAAPAGVVEVSAVETTPEDFAFLGPAQVASGWTTFRLTNSGEQPHFMLLWQLPEGVEFADYAAFSRFFQEAYDRYSGGAASRDEMLGEIVGALPEWFGELRAGGGVALTSPGRTAETTVHLEPGDYVMECYVVTPEGTFHGTLGMLRPLVVTEDDTGLAPPEPDVRVTLTNYAMAVEGELAAGEHVVAVHAAEPAEGIIFHDVNLARLAPDAALDEVGRWMSWIDALRPPAPADFLGGADHLAAGATAYFRADLEPGRYAFVSEGFAERGMVHEFSVE